MKQAQYIAIGLSVYLGMIGLSGCQQGQPTDEIVPAPDANDADSEPLAATSEATPPATAATSDTPSSTSPLPTDTTEVIINPPQAASLTAQEANSEINVRSQPTVDSTATGYGLVGDTVKLLKTADGTDGFAWYYAKFDESGAEGWIRGDFIKTEADATATADTSDGGYAVTIDGYTTDELFAVDSGGCGMSLKPVGNEQFVFFNGFETDSMWMKLDGTMTQFRKTSASGEEFYGQSTTQSFTSLDGAILVDVTVQRGAELGPEVIDVESGTLRLNNLNDVIEIPVEGDAGC